MPPPSPRADLAQCLSFALAPDERDSLRARLDAGGWRPLFAWAEERRLTPALAVAATARGLTSGIPPVTLPDGRMTPSAGLAAALTVHTERSRVLRQRLAELLAALGAEGIEPVLLKGARALWTGQPPWRTLRDLDLLVPEPDTRRAETAIMRLGYGTVPDGGLPDRWHHGENLYRADLPGWLEIHGRAAMARADRLLPTPMLAAARPMAGPDGIAARSLPLPLHILHCLLHHHIGHRGDKFGVMDFKGLYEFAGDVAALDAAGRAALRDAAARHPRLVAILDLWLAAAASLFRLPVEAPLAVRPDALARWQAMEARVAAARHGTYDGVLEELWMGVRSFRLRPLPGGQSWFGRQRLRASVVASLLAPATD